MNITPFLPHPPIPRRVIYVDMNSFFASVEQQVKPHLRGQPVAVCPFVNDATCVIAASVEAKRFGVKTGTNIRVARERCPQLQLISDDPSIYRDYHHRIVRALEATRCQVDVQSIDEAVLTLPADLRPHAMAVALEVRQLISEVGSQLNCSIGISSNRFLAKMGTKLHKPRGLVEIRLQDLEALYATLQLTDLYGIGWRLARRLEALGITTPLQLYRTSFEQLGRQFGVNGERWYLRLRGYEVDGRPTRRRSIGHQSTIVPDPAYRSEEVLSVANQLCYKAAVRLRAADHAATSIQVALRFTDRSWWVETERTAQPFWDSDSFYALATRALRRWKPGKPVRLVSVTAAGLVPRQALTASLFQARTKRSERLSEALDSIEARFGKHTVNPAIQLLSQRLQDRVGFGNTAA